MSLMRCREFSQLVVTSNALVAISRRRIYHGLLEAVVAVGLIQCRKSPRLVVTSEVRAVAPEWRTCHGAPEAVMLDTVPVELVR